MSHECEHCGQECYCDQEDSGGMPRPQRCPHICEEEEDEDFDMNNPARLTDDEFHDVMISPLAVAT